ncbi:MAG: lipocalin family protein [Spirosomataceae bacterium]
MKKSLSALLLYVLCLSCKEAVTPPTKTELLTGKSWQWVAGSISPAYDIFGIGILVGEDYFAKAPQCWRDDRWTFSAAYQFTHDEGASRCNIGDPQIYIQGVWKFESEESIIKITKDGGTEVVWTILELTSSSLKIAETFKEKGKTYTFQYAFSH